MTFPLHDLARVLEARHARKRTLRRLHQLQADPHLARDIGVAYRPRPHPRVDQW